jgi:membrane protein YdbS with pleckstrin-like domain
MSGRPCRVPPLCDPERVSASAEPFAPEGVTWAGVSPRLATARRLQALALAVLLVILIVVGALLLDWPRLAIPAVLPTAGAAWYWLVVGRQVRAWGYAEREEDLIVRHGMMWREIVVVPYGRMQYVDVQAGPLERALGIARIQLHTASAATDAAIPGVPAVEAARLRDRLASRGQARLAGL